MPLFIAFSDKGFLLARQLRDALGGELFRGGRDISVRDFAALGFEKDEDMIFVGAAGIAVRAVSQYCRSKATDPAVIAVDECAHFAVPLLSGHLGGANELARKISAVCGAQAAITTATDANSVFAVDEWARVQGLHVLNPERIKHVSGRILSGQSIKISSPYPLPEVTPRGVEITDAGTADVILDIKRSDREALKLVPGICVLGVGCRKGTDREKMRQAFEGFMDSCGIYPQAVSTVASIDLKQNEDALIELCKQYYFNFSTFSAEELREVKGEFESSEFVRQITGVDNVCARAAAKLGKIIVPKTVYNGITFSLSVQDFIPDWRPYDE